VDLSAVGLKVNHQTTVFDRRQAFVEDAGVVRDYCDPTTVRLTVFGFDASCYSQGIFFE
jgi:hypothetical protein